MQTENQLQRTAQFFNPVCVPRQGRSFKKQSPILPLMKEIEDFDLLVSKELDKYNKRVLRINGNLNNVSIRKPRVQKIDCDTHTISTAPHSLNQSKSMLNLIPINNSPDKLYRPRNIKVIFDPFNQAVTRIIRNRQSRNQSVGSCDSAPEIQRTEKTPAEDPEQNILMQVSKLNIFNSQMNQKITSKYQCPLQQNHSFDDVSEWIHHLTMCRVQNSIITMFICRFSHFHWFDTPQKRILHETFQCPKRLQGMSQEEVILNENNEVNLPLDSQSELLFRQYIKSGNHQARPNYRNFLTDFKQDHVQKVSSVKRLKSLADISNTYK